MLDGDEVLVEGAPSARIGELAFAAGIPLHELVPEASSLEDIFLELTAKGRDRPAAFRAAQDALDPHQPRAPRRHGRADLLTVILNGFITKKLNSPISRTSTRCSRPAPRRRCLPR